MVENRVIATSVVSVLAAVAVLGAPAPPSLLLRIEPRASHLIVGEPTSVKVSWSSLVPLSVSVEHLQVWMDDGSGSRRWNETDFGSDVSIGRPIKLNPGTTLRTSFIVGASGPVRGRYQLAFGKPGTYRLVARYQNNAVSASSNVVAIVVVPPEGHDAQVFSQHVSGMPIIISERAPLLGDEILRVIFDSAGNSPYIARAKLLHLQEKVREAIREAPGPVPPNAPIGGDVPRALSRLAAEDLGDTVFNEMRLLSLARLYDESGRPAEAVVTWRDLLLRYPVGYAADVARTRLNLPPVPVI